MWTEEEIVSYLKENLKEKRFKHSLSVRDTAVKLAEFYNEDAEKAKIAGLVHDCAKYLVYRETIEISKKYGYDIDEISLKNPELLHGVAGAYIAKNTMGIEDKQILNAIVCHTTGKINMSVLEKIIFIADYIEPLRNFPGVEEVRRKTYENLDEALIMAFNKTIKYVVENGQLLHLDTVKARNYLMY